MLSTTLCCTSLENLEATLKMFNISTDQWVKTTKALYKEIEEEDCFLEINDNQIIRRVEVIRVKCFYKDEQGECFQLKEDRQVFTDGKSRERNFDFVAEKMKACENPEQGAFRALEEELQIPRSRIKVTSLPDENECVTMDSPSYKGLTSIYKTHYFSTQIPEDQYKPTYSEFEGGKTTYFSWKHIPKETL